MGEELPGSQRPLVAWDPEYRYINSLGLAAEPRKVVRVFVEDANLTMQSIMSMETADVDWTVCKSILEAQMEANRALEDALLCSVGPSKGNGDADSLEATKRQLDDAIAAHQRAIEDLELAIKCIQDAHA